MMLSSCWKAQPESIEIVCWVDEDDQRLDTYLQIADKFPICLIKSEKRMTHSGLLE